MVVPPAHFFIDLEFLNLAFKIRPIAWLPTFVGDEGTVGDAIVAMQYTCYGILRLLAHHSRVLQQFDNISLLDLEDTPDYGSSCVEKLFCKFKRQFMFIESTDEGPALLQSGQAAGKAPIISLLLY